MLYMNTNRNNTILIKKLQENEIPLDGLNAKGSIMSTDKSAHSEELSDFTKKYLKNK